MSIKHGIAVGDLHCGHLVGLTPPAWQIRPTEGQSTKRDKWYIIAMHLWKEFDIALQQLPKKLDFVLALGDLIEGKGKKSGGTECLTTDMQEQCNMATGVFNHIRKYSNDDVKIVGVYGTDYHTSILGDDWENTVAKDARFHKIGAHEWVDVNGYIFDLKHKIGGSQIPHGRHTAIARDQLWNLLWAEREMQPKANMLLRGHVHYHTICGDVDKMAMTMPALQGMGSKYGAKECSGTVDWGFIHFKVDDRGECEWKTHIKKIFAQRAKTVEV